MEELKSNFERISPEVAAMYLTHNKANRPLNQKTIAFYAKQMREGQWMANGESICFDENGDLLNGQHRLSAIVESGVTIEALVVRGLKSECFKTYDTGKKRTSADVLSIAGCTSYAITAAIVGRYLRMLQGANEQHAKDAGISNADIHAEYTNNREYYDALANQASSYYQHLHLFTTSDIGSTIIWLNKVKEHSINEILEFFNDLFYSTNVSGCAAITLLRERITRDAMQVTKMPHSHKMALLKKAWNAYTTNTILKCLSYNAEREKNLKFK